MIVNGLIYLCLIITTIVVYWIYAMKAFAAFKEDSKGGPYTDDGFLSFVVNFSFYMAIVGQCCMALCVLCACCALICGGGAVFAQYKNKFSNKTYYADDDEHTFKRA